MEHTIVIGHIALIQKSKKQWFTLDLIKVLREKGYDAVGVFAGECREPAYMSELNRKIEEYGLSGQTIFLGRRNDIPDLLKMVDVLIIPSAFEGFPLAGLEAAAAGVPVIACDAAGAKEFIQVSKDGLTFKEDDVDSAVNAVEGIMKDRESFQKAGESFAAEMTGQKYASKLDRIFSEIE